MLRVHYRPPELMPPHQRDFPARDSAPEVADALHVRDTRFLLLMVTGYLMAVLGGVVILNMLSPVTHATIPTEAANVKATGR